MSKVWQKLVGSSFYASPFQGNVSVEYPTFHHQFTTRGLIVTPGLKGVYITKVTVGDQWLSWNMVPLEVFLMKDQHDRAFSEPWPTVGAGGKIGLEVYNSNGEVVEGSITLVGLEAVKGYI